MDKEKDILELAKQILPGVMPIVQPQQTIQGVSPTPEQMAAAWWSAAQLFASALYNEMNKKENENTNQTTEIKITN